jgi:hypothetical protein
MEKTNKPILNIDYQEYDNINIYPKIKNNDCFLITPVIKPIIKPLTNNINNSVINLKRKRSSSF